VENCYALSSTEASEGAKKTCYARQILIDPDNSLTDKDPDNPGSILGLEFFDPQNWFRYWGQGLSGSSLYGIPDSEWAFRSLSEKYGYTVNEDMTIQAYYRKKNYNFKEIYRKESIVSESYDVTAAIDIRRGQYAGAGKAFNKQDYRLPSSWGWANQREDKSFVAWLEGAKVVGNGGGNHMFVSKFECSKRCYTQLVE
jgi:hypothetical protein